MIISDLSIKRPVFATVINIVLVVFGVIAFLELPLRGYPDIDPPVVSVETVYPGASANVVESKITQLLEDQLSGVEGLRVLSSESREGKSQINLEFSLKRNIDAAANDVREAVTRVIDRLPDEAKPPQVNKSDADSSVIVWFAISSSLMSQLELSDYVDRYVVDRFKVVDGVARVQIWGERRYVMRITLDRSAMAARGITANDIENVLRAENVELPAGKIESVDREFTVRVARAFNNADEFRQLVLVRGKPEAGDGHLVRLGEVATVELAARDEKTAFRGMVVPGAPAENMVGIGIIKQSKANTVDVTRMARAVAADIQKTLPEHMKLNVTFDTAVFLERSVEEVYVTLALSMVLVVLVIYIFLGSWRATLIPALTVPVSIIGACIFAWLFGFSINILTLMACVLAIGLVVDDAIVVLENVHRRIERGEPPLLAAINGSREVAFAVIATSLVLVAVFVPIVFMEGNISRLFGEFALTLAAAVAVSAFVALTLCAMLCSKWLVPHSNTSRMARLSDQWFARIENSYSKNVQASVRKPSLAVLVLLLSSVLVWLYFNKIPREFDPGEDRGIFILVVQGPEGASFENTQSVLLEIERRLQPQVGGESLETVLLRLPGFFGGVNSGLGLIVLKPWEDRKKTGDQVMADVQAMLADIPGMQIYSFMRKPLAAASGQPLEIVIGGDTYEELSQWSALMLKAAYANPKILRPVIDLKETQPQLQVKIDRERAADLGVSVGNIGRTLETLLGEREVTTFFQRGEEYDVLLRGDEKQFASKADMENIFVRSDRSGSLVPLANLVTIEEVSGARSLTRFNRMRSFTLSAGLAPGYATSDALAYFHDVVARDLPPQAHIDYKGLTLEYVRSSGSMWLVVAIALLMVYLVLAAQFESFIHPFIILLTVPFALLGALAALDFMGMTINVYSQIAMIMLIGLAAKNGILMVEFANQLRDRGMALQEAIQAAATQRLRPILMTSLTAAIGALPLVFSSGAGANSRMIIGIVVFAGVILSTLMTLFIVPTMYAMLARNTGSPGKVAQAIRELQGES
ncbi:MAG: efflux RND transporter permease subunit [Cellvibrionales bacterium]|nr:efflux RND transporter permease subunit [Cellvibrionales bacterium]